MRERSLGTLTKTLVRKLLNSSKTEIGEFLQLTAPNRESSLKLSTVTLRVVRVERTVLRIGKKKNWLLFWVMGLLLDIAISCNLLAGKLKMQSSAISSKMSWLYVGVVGVERS